MLSLNNEKFTQINCSEIEKYILDVPRFTKKNTVKDTQRFLELLGNPGEQSRIIHVAGTNGKGSVCAYLCSVLEQTGKKVGMFTSPHLIDMRERFRIEGKMVSRELFANAFGHVMGGLDEMKKKVKRQDYHPSFFELLFLMGMVIFSWERTDYIILETGLGGRLDATNAVKNPIVTVITEIGMDHMEYLGDTIEKIAGEKAGIIKNGVPVVYCDKRAEASKVIAEHAETLGAKQFPVSQRDYVYHNLNNKSIDFSFHSRYYDYIRLTLNTRALYQMENAALAVRTLEVISGKAIGAAHIVKGIADTVWEGRMEEIAPGIFVDGAHNADGFTAFLETVEADQCQGERYMLYAASADKDYRHMAGSKALGQLFTHIAAARMSHSRSAEIEDLRKAFSVLEPGKCSFFENVKDALRDLRFNKNKDDFIYIVGSLYLVGEVKTLIKEENG